MPRSNVHHVFAQEPAESQILPPSRSRSRYRRLRSQRRYGYGPVVSPSPSSSASPSTPGMRSRCRTAPQQQLPGPIIAAYWACCRSPGRQGAGRRPPRSPGRRVAVAVRRSQPQRRAIGAAMPQVHPVVKSQWLRCRLPLQRRDVNVALPYDRAARSRSPSAWCSTSARLTASASRRVPRTGAYRDAPERDAYRASGPHPTDHTQTIPTY